MSIYSSNSNAFAETKKMQKCDENYDNFKVSENTIDLQYTCLMSAFKDCTSSPLSQLISDVPLVVQAASNLHVSGVAQFFEETKLDQNKFAKIDEPWSISDAKC